VKEGNKLSDLDPFENAPSDSAVAVEVTAEKPAVAAASDGKVVLTFKGGRGYEAPWIVIHANGLQEAHDFVVGDNATLLAVVMDRVQTASKHFAGIGGDAAPAQAPAQAGGPPPGSQAAPGGEKRYCNHGEMVFKTGVAKASGKPYSLFSCTAPRDQQCKAQFL
jgi:hypothetical protein